jgi:hypothetical protein
VAKADFLVITGCYKRMVMKAKGRQKKGRDTTSPSSFYLMD